MREYLGELFAEKCPQYFALPESERPAFILATLPSMLRAFVASALFSNELRAEDLPFTFEPLPLPEDPDREDAAMFSFLTGVLDSWTASIDAHLLYSQLGEDFQSLVDAMGANYKYGPFFNTPTLEHADYLVTHPQALTRIRTVEPAPYSSGPVWDSYLARFPKNAKRPQREPDSRLIEENLDALVSAAGLSLSDPSL
jgi:hypothetical protein